MRIKLTHIYEWLINVMNIQKKKILMSDKIDSQRILVSRGYHTHKLYCTYKQTDRQTSYWPSSTCRGSPNHCTYIDVHILQTKIPSQDPKNIEVTSVSVIIQLSLHERGHVLETAMYEQASQALEDDYEDVRLAAIKLVWVFSHICPER